METGAITQYVDVAQIVLYIFWVFFFGLIYYLLRENHREGYPMDNGRENGPKMDGWPAVPTPKVYKLANGHEVLSPDHKRPDGVFKGQPMHPWLGAPLEPVGDPLLAGLGPGAWANRADVPEMTMKVKSRSCPCAWPKTTVWHLKTPTHADKMCTVPTTKLRVWCATSGLTAPRCYFATSR